MMKLFRRKKIKQEELMETKSWYLSKTVWGVLITFTGMITKKYFNFYIPDVSTDIVEGIGLIVALYGRIKAQKKLQ